MRGKDKSEVLRHFWFCSKIHEIGEILTLIGEHIRRICYSKSVSASFVPSSKLLLKLYIEGHLIISSYCPFMKHVAVLKTCMSLQQGF
jgi:hypothetical protein